MRHTLYAVKRAAHAEFPTWPLFLFGNKSCIVLCEFSSFSFQSRWPSSSSIVASMGTSLSCGSLFLRGNVQNPRKRFVYVQEVRQPVDQCLHSHGLSTRTVVRPVGPGKSALRRRNGNPITCNPRSYHPNSRLSPVVLDTGRTLICDFFIHPLPARSPGWHWSPGWH